jgi:hypothetical protein
MRKIIIKIAAYALSSNLGNLRGMKAAQAAYLKK